MATKRIDFLDILRGFALIGILFANIPGIARISVNTDLDIQIYRFVGFVFEQRFFPIFSFLFGLGFFIFMHNAERKGLPPIRLMIRRLLLLLLFGIAHQFLQPGEALLFYSILGFGLLPLYKWAPKLVFLAFLVFLVLGVFVIEYFTILSMFYLGLFVGKIGYFDKLERYRRPTQVLWLVSLLLIAPLLWLQNYFNASNSWGSWQSLAGLDIAAFMVTSLLLWAQTERWLMPLAAFGRMALTNYIMQTVVVFSLTLALGGFGSLTMKSVPFVWLAVWVVQVILSNLWLRYFNYGPLEWMWRWGTYGHRPIFVKNKPAEMS